MVEIHSLYPTIDRGSEILKMLPNFSPLIPFQKKKVPVTLITDESYDTASTERAVFNHSLIPQVCSYITALR